MSRPGQVPSEVESACVQYVLSVEPDKVIGEIRLVDFMRWWRKKKDEEQKTEEVAHVHE